MMRPKEKRLTAKACGAIVLAFIGLAFVSIGGWAGYLHLTGNIHVVSPDIVYRAGQLDKLQFASALQKFRIKSIINLRGENAGEDWYEGERNLAKRLGVAHYDVGMYSNSEVDDATVAKLLVILKSAPRPILIHCDGGADRSGLAAAIYKRFIEGTGIDEASRQLSVWYGHVPWFIRRTAAMDRTFARLTSQK